MIIIIIIISNIGPSSSLHFQSTAWSVSLWIFFLLADTVAFEMELLNVAFPISCASLCAIHDWFYVEFLHYIEIFMNLGNEEHLMGKLAVCLNMSLSKLFNRFKINVIKGFCIKICQEYLI
jgi:hypothetical protein